MKIEKTISLLGKIENKPLRSAKVTDSRCLLICVTAFMVVMLSVPSLDIGMLLTFALFPMVMAPLCGLSFNRLLVSSLISLPFTVIIGIFNPIYDKTPLFVIHNIVITSGWVSFLAIILRGMLALQALLLLIGTYGFIGLCRAMERLGVPSWLSVQLQFVFHYMRVILEELLTMKRARAARGYGRKNYHLREWGALIGQLVLRSLDRSQRIHKAMCARGFNGTIPRYEPAASHWRVSDSICLIVCLAVFVVLRFAAPLQYISIFH